jgi:hypothetical protein
MQSIGLGNMGGPPVETAGADEGKLWADPSIRPARQAGAEHGTPLLTADVADEILTKAERLGYTHRDIPAVHDQRRQPGRRTRGRLSEAVAHTCAVGSAPGHPFLAEALVQRGLTGGQQRSRWPGVGLLR